MCRWSCSCTGTGTGTGTGPVVGTGISQPRCVARRRVAPPTRRRPLPRRMPKTVLLTGASGYLGQHLLLALSTRRDLVLHGAYSDLETFPLDFGSICTCHKVDVSNPGALSSLLQRVEPDVVVHAAALSSPRTCEEDPTRAMAINSPTALVDHLPKKSSIVFLSTDQVYDGTGAPYTEEPTSPAPVNTYGASKLAFERVLQARLPTRHVSLRSSLILGPAAPRRCKKAGSFLQDVERLLSSPEGATFFSNEMRSAVDVADVIRVISWAIDGGTTSHPGVFNMGGPASLSRVDIASAVASHRRLAAERIHKKPRPEGGPVKSPLDITMDSSKLQRASGVEMRALDGMVRAAFASAHRPRAWTPSPSTMLALGVLTAAVTLAVMGYASRR